MRRIPTCRIALMATVLINWSTSCVQNKVDAVQNRMDVAQNKGHEQVDIVAVAASPDHEFIAASYIVSGGGGAGYVYKVVNLRREGEPFNPEKDIVFSVTKTSSITLIWEDNEHLLIKHSNPGSIYKQLKEWGSERKISISYSIEPG